MHMAGGEGIGIESAQKCKLHGIPYTRVSFTIILILCS